MFGGGAIAELVNILSLSSLCFSGGFALLAGTVAAVGGLGGAAGGAAAGALALSGVVTGLVPLAAAGALGVLGRKLYIAEERLSLDLFIRSVLYDVCWPPVLHHTRWSVLSPGSRP